MRIIVFDVPAENGGALTILKQYYETAINDSNNEWIFVVSKVILERHKNIQIISFPWVKKSWIHRLYFDLFIANKLVKSLKADEILSLQNVIIPNSDIKQTLYLHQPLPFVEKRFGFFENTKFWIYQNIINKAIYHSIRKADLVIVQTQWMLDAASKKTNTHKDKFVLQKPVIQVNSLKKYQVSNSVSFFYPASAISYKNHKVIMDACNLIKEKHKYVVYLTLSGEENKTIKKIKKTAEKMNLPILFIGKLDINHVYEYYCKSILLFPSYIETLGLPLLEAQVFNTPIIAANTSFAKEILELYDKKDFFDPDDSDLLSRLMLNYIRKGTNNDFDN